ncbi:hypothetical protein Tco_0143015, partial [Tanacetum coccineum]
MLKSLSQSVSQLCLILRLTEIELSLRIGTQMMRKKPSVSTARPVCTARPSVSTVRPVSTAKSSVSTARPVYATRPIYLRMDNNMTTAGIRAVVNTGKGKLNTDLKKSRWVWRPK